MVIYLVSGFINIFLHPLKLFDPPTSKKQKEVFTLNEATNPTLKKKEKKRKRKKNTISIFLLNMTFTWF